MKKTQPSAVDRAVRRLILKFCEPLKFSKAIRHRKKTSKREEIISRQARVKQVSTLKKGNSVPAKLPKREAVNTRKESAKNS